MDQASRNSETMFDDSSLEDALDKVISLACKHRGAEIDAGACGTRRDFDNMHAAEEKFQEARDAFLARFAEADDVGALRAKVTGLISALRATTARLKNAREALANAALCLGDE